jgi:hypothetical protein
MRPRARRSQASLGALGDEGAFQLCDRSQHLQREHALRGRCVDRIAQATKMRAAGFELLDHREQVADRAGEPVQPDHDEGFVRADLTEQAREDRAAAIGAGGVFLEDGVATGGTQFVALRIGALLFGGHAGVADQTGPATRRH